MAAPRGSSPPIGRAEGPSIHSSRRGAGRAVPGGGHGAPRPYGALAGAAGPRLRRRVLEPRAAPSVRPRALRRRSGRAGAAGHGFSLHQRILQCSVPSSHSSLRRAAADTDLRLLGAILQHRQHGPVPTPPSCPSLGLWHTGLPGRGLLAAQAADCWVLPAADPRDARSTVSIWRPQPRGQPTAQGPGGGVGPPCLWGATAVCMACSSSTREPIPLRIAPTLDWQWGCISSSCMGLKGICL